MAIFSQGFNAAKKPNQAVAVSFARRRRRILKLEMANITSGTYNLGEINLNNVTYGRTIQISDDGFPVSSSA